MSWTANPGVLNQFAVTMAFQKDNYLGEAHARVAVDVVLHYAFYVAFIAIFLMVVALIVKLMWSSDEDGASDRQSGRLATENTTLLSSKVRDFVVTIYGTNENDDCLEPGDKSCSEDLYDGKICVICYDDQRTCFFIPCGHCVTCHNCAHRIVKEESKSCPICRGSIYKVSQLRAFVERM